MLQLTLTVIVVFEIVSKTTYEDEKTTTVAVQLMIDQVITQLINTFRTGIFPNFFKYYPVHRPQKTFVLKSQTILSSAM